MAPWVEISIPSAVLSSDTSSKPYTLYNISLRLPLRTFIVQKRYSDFTLLDSTLKSQVGQAPPKPLPSKSWFSSTTNNPKLTEQRRADLEAYLQAIASAADRRWRETTTWRVFLNLPSGTGTTGSSRDAAHAAVTAPGGAVLDPTTWLDVHREMKGQLHDARLHLGRRDAASTAHGQHEAGANAKRCLVKGAQLIGTLEEGLKGMMGSEGWGGAALGEGELRRRRDLLASARVEKEGLEKLAMSLAVQGQSVGSSNNSSSGVKGPALATGADKGALFGPAVARPPGGRILGAPIPETDKTRELDNEGVLQLQKQIIADQNLDVQELAKIVQRQKEMGVAIGDELDYQNSLLERLDQDVDRVKGKIDVAKKRVAKLNK